MTLVKGRNFDKSFATDRNACAINESAARNFEITDIESTRILQPTPSGEFKYLQIIGIVKDFNLNHSAIPSNLIFSFAKEMRTFGDM